MSRTTAPEAGRSAASGGAQAIDRAADLVYRVVAGGGDPVTFTQLCEEAGYARSTTSRLLGALERNNLLRRDDSGGWLPGSLFEQYASGATRNERLVHLATPFMEKLGGLTGETVNLAVPAGESVVQIAQIDSTFFLGSIDWVGVDVPVHTSAMGKVLLAHGAVPVPSGRLARLTPATVTSATELHKHLEQIRADGYAATIDELEVGLVGIAAPVRSHGRVVAALGLSGPTSRLADLPTTGAHVVAQADALSARLGPHRKKGAA